MMGMKADQVILTRQLPKTGQVTIYEPGDDGAVQAGWWKGLSIADNRERFIPFISDGKTLVRDKATGLIWPADWDNMGDYYGLEGAYDNTFQLWLPEVNGLNYGGFSDWRIPNVFELMSLIECGGAGLWIDTDIFDNVDIYKYWTGTTDRDYTDWAFGVYFDDNLAVSTRKTDWINRIACRGGL